MAATLVAVNVGMPKDVQWRGKTVHTGIWKTPVDGPVTTYSQQPLEEPAEGAVLICRAAQDSLLLSNQER